ncbi:MAG: hypothetical protein PHR45_01780 [Muribaculaceae bacterium]|nr:hypothetical protein [Muribaculaceae bacterium]
MHNDFLTRLEQAKNKIESNIEVDGLDYNLVKRLNQAISRQVCLIKNLIDRSMTAPENEKFLKDFRIQISTARLSESVWSDLRFYVDATNNNIIKKLAEENPELTPLELNF